jgi:multiple sugar transport system permease protein
MRLWAPRWKPVLLTAAGIAVCAAFLFPVYWVFVSSLKSNAEIFGTPQTLWPSAFHVENYGDQFTGEFSILPSLLNSLILSVPTMLLAAALGIPAAFGLARYKLPGRKSLILGFLISQMLPATLVLTPLFLIFSQLHLINTYWSTIIADTTIGIPFIVLFLRPFFLSFPSSMLEAARIDGCGTFQAFLRIILPISQSGIVTALAFAFLFAWNNLIFPMTFSSIPEMRPLTAGIYTYLGSWGIEWNKIMAYAVILITPVILIFVFLQKHIVGGLTSGSVKE